MSVFLIKIEFDRIIIYFRSLKESEKAVNFFCNMADVLEHNLIFVQKKHKE